MTDDLIGRQQAIDALRDYLVGKRCPDDGTLTCRLIENEVINKLPSIQPDIIYCKDCKWYGRADKRRFYRGMDCLQKRIDTIVPDRDFCSKAERREQDE